jgi:hypothetical protein
MFKAISNPQRFCGRRRNRRNLPVFGFLEVQLVKSRLKICTMLVVRTVICTPTVRAIPAISWLTLVPAAQAAKSEFQAVACSGRCTTSWRTSDRAAHLPEVMR